MCDNTAPDSRFPYLPRAGLAFGLFVFWLLAVPMEGPLLAHAPGDHHLFLFLVPHATTLLAIARFWPQVAFPAASRLAVVATALLTVALGLFPGLQGPLLAACGASAAFVSVRAGVLLRQNARPLTAAACGLVGGNLLLLLVIRLDSAAPAGHLLAAAALCGVLLPVAAGAPARSMAGLRRYLPAVFLFQVVSGLMYTLLLAAYAGQALWAGGELFCYLGTVALAVPLLRRDRELLLVLGVVLGLGAFLVLHGGGAGAVNLAMFGMQAAAGCVDMFLLALMLSSPDPQRAFGYGNGVLCAGILAGAGCSRVFGDVAGPAIVLSQLALNGAVLVLYLQNRRAGGVANPQAVAGPVAVTPSLPAEVQVLLSGQECQVLEAVAAGRTYREVAESLEISESSVKTYMHRICGKLGAVNKKDLLVKLSRMHASTPAPSPFSPQT